MATRAGIVLTVIAALAACGGHPTPHGPAHTCAFFETEFHTGSIDKIDLLFVVDNSPSMGDKAALLSTALPDLLNRLMNPECVDQFGSVVGVSSNGMCAAGNIARPPVRDLHAAILSSSLGAAGGDLCDADGVASRRNDRAELLNRVGSDEHSVGDAEPSHFLAWFPSARVALGQPTPPVPPVTNALRLVGDFADMVAGVHTSGCPFEAPLEAMYRFLMQPDPYDHVEIVSGRASLVGVDATLLRQRRDFLRPDSLLDIVVVTGENDASIDPLAFGAQAWQFASARFPGSPAGTAPRATRECANPNDPACSSCALLIGHPDFADRCPHGAFLDPSEDPLALRFFHMKERFGINALFPTSRYVRGLGAKTVPDRNHEHDVTGAYADAPSDCVNPIFAQNLPTDPGGDLCHLARGQRTPDLVQFTVVGGVPHELLQTKAGVDPECPAGTLQPDCPQATQLTDAQWTAITGKDPEHFDFMGVDPHMIESSLPRAGLPTPAARDDADPINGREWTTHGAALELACTFALATPKKDCTPSELAPGCDCGAGGDMPVCDASGAQVRGKAYPSIRQAVVAHAMANSPNGVQGAVSSICPVHVAESAPGDPIYVFRPVLNSLFSRVIGGGPGGPACIPTPLPRDSSGRVPCTVLVALPFASSESLCAAYGLEVPDADVLRRFRAQQKTEWRKFGGPASGWPDPQTVATCLVPQLAGPDLDADGWCTASPKEGWCAGRSRGGFCSPDSQGMMVTPSLSADIPSATITLMCSDGC